MLSENISHHRHLAEEQGEYFPSLHSGRDFDSTLTLGELSDHKLPEDDTTTINAIFSFLYDSRQRI